MGIPDGIIAVANLHAQMYPFRPAGQVSGLG